MTPAFQRALEATATDPSHRHYPAAVRMVVEYGEGLPAQTIDVNVRVQDVRDRIIERVDRIARTR